MDDLGNWVYIILMVVVGISSFISSVNKKKRQQQTHIPFPQPPEPSYPMPSPPPPAPKRKEIAAPPPIRKKMQHQPLAFHLSVPAEDISSDEISSAPLEDEVSIINELKLNNTDDFKKAIIYAEIINRKYK